MKTDQVISPELVTVNSRRGGKNTDSSAPQGIEAQISTLVRIIKRRRRWVVAVFGVVITYIGYNTLKDRATNPVYQGSFQVLLRDPIDSQPGRQISGVTNLPPGISDPSISVSNLPDLISVLTSPAILHPISVSAGLPPTALDGKVDIFQLNPRTDGILQVNLRWNDPAEGQKLINNLANGYIDYSTEQRQIRLARGLRFLDEQAPLLQTRVNKFQQDLAVFRTSNGFLEPEERARQISGKMSETESRISKLQTEYLQLESLRDAVKSGQLVSPSLTGANSLPGGEAAQAGAPLISTSAFSQLLNSLIDVEKQIAEISGSFKSDSPVIQSLIAKRNQIRPLLQRRELDSIDASLRDNLNAQEALRNQYQTLFNVFKLEGPDLVKQYQSLSQRLDVARDSLTSTIRQRESIRLEMAQQARPWQIIQAPYFLTIPVSPNITKELRSGLILAAIAGVSAGLIRDKFDRVYHSAEEVEKILEVPLIGTIPYIDKDHKQAALRLAHDSSSNNDATQLLRLRESVRNIYATLNVMRTTQTLKVLAVTSVSAHEGKTTSTAILGKSFAELGIRVLLIDGDMRKSKLHEVLEIENNNGFSGLFSLSSDSITQNIKWLGPNLAIITGGYKPPDPAKLLSSQRLPEIVEEIRRSGTFDLVLIDTPPALDLVDPILISRNADGLVLLVALGKTDKLMLSKTISRLETAGIDLIGMLCTESPDTPAPQEYEHYYNVSVPNDTSVSTRKNRLVESMSSRGKTLFAWLDKR